MFEVYYSYRGGDRTLYHTAYNRADAAVALWRYYRRHNRSDGYRWWCEEVAPLELKRRAHADLTDDLKPDWLNDDWYQPLANLHFAELREVDEVAMVAFYENERKRDSGTQTTMRVGRYIRRFAKKGEGQEAVYRDEEIERLVAAHDVKLQGSRVKITQDADEIETVYVNGPSSCMSHDAGHFSGSEHPCRVYAGPDLGVAYLGDIDDASARAIVWPEKKVYGGVYGDVSRMEMMLDKMGYTQDGSFHGARMRRIECANTGAIIFPYCDIATRVGDTGNYLEIGAGYDIETGNTNGLGIDDNSVMCGRCDDRVDGEDTSYVETGRYRGESWCDSCADNYAVRCEHSGSLTSEGATTSVEAADGEDIYVADWNLDDYGAVELDGTWYAPDAIAQHPVTGDDIHVDDLPAIEAELAAEGEAAPKGLPLGHPNVLPRMTLAEAEAAGQMSLDLTLQPANDGGADLFEVVGRSLRGNEAPFRCVIRGAIDPEDYVYTGTLAECEEARDRVTSIHGHRYTYAVEPAGTLAATDGLALAA